MWCITDRAWPIHRQHSPSGPIVGQSEPSANDDNRWPVCADVSRWCYSIHLAMGSIGHLCRTIQGSARYNAFDDYSSAEGGICLMMEGQQPMQYCSSFEGVSVIWSSCSSITLLYQQSLSQAWIECGNINIIGPPSHRLYKLGISCHRYEIFNGQNDKKKT